MNNKTACQTAIFFNSFSDEKLMSYDKETRFKFNYLRVTT